MLFLLACAGAPDSGAFESGTPDSGAEDTATTPRSRELAFAAEVLQEHVSFLASDELAGREAGSEGDLLAVAYIEDALDAAGWVPPDGGWEQPFVDSGGTDSLNVLGVRWGADPEVGDEIVIVGAHHDHLGLRGDGSVFAGANDNASGVAVLLGLADAFGSGEAPDRTLVLASWGSEEVEIDGSRAYLEDPPADLPLADTVFYVNLDMVGTYDGYGILYALDAARGTVAREVTSAAAGDSRLEVDLSELGELSDSVNFCEAEIPEVFFFTEDPDCYHRPCDTADRLDYDDLSAVGELVAAVVDQLVRADLDLAGPRAEGCPVN